MLRPNGCGVCISRGGTCPGSVPKRNAAEWADSHESRVRALAFVQARSGPLDPGKRQLRQLGRHLSAIADCDHVVIVMAKAGGIAIGAPELLG